MFGRRTRTNLPTTTELLTSAYDESAHDALLVAKRRQANYYDRRARPRQPLSVGDTVRTRWNKHDDWEKAVITKVLPHRSYQLRFEDGSTRRRTSKHVRFLSEPPLVIRDEIEVAPTANGAPPPPARPASSRRVAERPTAQRVTQRPSASSTAGNNITITKSGRYVKRPQRYADYVS